jgi:hypothetical protein
MTLKLADIAPLEGAPPTNAARKRRVGESAQYVPSRRDVLRGMLAVGAGAGIAALGVFPTARPAGASSPPGGWKIWSGCSGLGSWVSDDNCNGCNQKTLCCCDANGYHKGSDYGCKYALRPDQCASGGYDGWTWTYGGCCWVACQKCVKNRKWRCTDGYYNSDCAGSPVQSICRYVVTWGTGCSPCPC